MQNVVTVFRILIYQKRHIFVQFLYQKIRNNVGYSYMLLTQKPELTTFYHCSDVMLSLLRRYQRPYSEMIFSNFGSNEATAAM